MNLKPHIRTLSHFCSYLKLNGTWTAWERYPLKIAESLGGMIGNDFIVVSGFSGAFNETTTKVYAIDTTNSTAKWRAMDDVPVPGFTHSADVVVGSVMYICGGYVGATPGPDTPICLKYSHTNAPTQQWSFLPNLTDGRGGGALIYLNEKNSLLYTAGATRRGTTVDFNTTWELDLDNLATGWIQRADIPYKGNHISRVAATYQGKNRYYVAGGQLQQQEKSGNQNSLYEWDVINSQWIQRANMTIARGHASSSTRPYGCGFIMAGGAINDGNKTADISYYGINTNSWTTIGLLPQAINTPICDIVSFGPGNDWVYCQTGNVGGYFSWRTRIYL
jgi:N-acetylneuraminic acid mutarotase